MCLPKSNNGDMQMVLATVIQIIKAFLSYKPDSNIYIEGSTPTRMRLYQIAIERELSDFQEHFEIGGFYNNAFELFRRNVNYSARVIFLKKSQLVYHSSLKNYGINSERNKRR